VNEKEIKLCPVLSAGWIGHEGASPLGFGKVGNPCRCMEYDCEWYAHGCPAYPTSVDVAALKAAGGRVDGRRTGYYRHPVAHGCIRRG
jgi:hypothetical protein